jgi:hypothetical protein
MTINELEVGCGDFKVVEPTSIVFFMAMRMWTVTLWRPEPHSHSEARCRMVQLWNLAGLPVSVSTCVCSVQKEKEFSHVLGNVVHPFYTFEFVHNTFTKNVFPVCLETIEYDGETKEPKSPRRQAGRPPKKNSQTK